MSRAEERERIYETYLTAHDATSQRFVRQGGALQGETFYAHDLVDCTVLVLEVTGQVIVERVSESQIFIGPCKGSVFLRNCQNCIVTVACGQLRMSDCSGCIVCVHTPEGPALEGCRNMTFGPWNGAYEGLAEHLRLANLSGVRNRWRAVLDFTAAGLDERGATQGMRRGVEGSDTVHFLDESEWYAEDGGLSAAARLAVLGLFEEFDRDGDGRWKLGDFNANQVASGEDPDALPASMEEVCAMLGMAGVEVSPAHGIGVHHLWNLWTAQGAGSLREELQRLGRVRPDGSAVVEWAVPAPSVPPLAGPEVDFERRPVNPLASEDAADDEEEEEEEEEGEEEEGGGGGAAEPPAPAPREGRPIVPILSEKRRKRPPSPLQRPASARRRHMPTDPGTPQEAEAWAHRTLEELAKRMREDPATFAQLRRLCLDGTTRPSRVIPGPALSFPDPVPASAFHELLDRMGLAVPMPVAVLALAYLGAKTPAPGEEEGHHAWILSAHVPREVLWEELKKLRVGRSGDAAARWARKKRKTERRSREARAATFEAALNGNLPRDVRVFLRSVPPGPSPPALSPAMAAAWLSERDVSGLCEDFAFLSADMVRDLAVVETLQWLSTQTGLAAVRRAGMHQGEDGGKGAEEAQREVAREKVESLVNEWLEDPGVAEGFFWSFAKAVSRGAHRGDIISWLKAEASEKQRKAAQVHEWEEQKGAQFRRAVSAAHDWMPLVVVAREMSALERLAAKPQPHGLWSAMLPSRQGLDISARVVELRARAIAPHASEETGVDQRTAQSALIVSRADVLDTLGAPLRSLLADRQTAKRAREMLDPDAAARFQVDQEGRGRWREEDEGGRSRQVSQVAAEIRERLHIASSREEGFAIALKLAEEAQQACDDGYEEWLKSKRAAQRRKRKEERAAQQAKEKAEEARRRRAMKLFNRWNRALQRSQYLTKEEDGKRRRAPRPGAGVIEGRPPWVDIADEMKEKERAEAAQAAEEEEKRRKAQRRRARFTSLGIKSTPNTSRASIQTGGKAKPTPPRAATDRFWPPGLGLRPPTHPRTAAPPGVAPATAPLLPEESQEGGGVEGVEVEVEKAGVSRGSARDAAAPPAPAARVTRPPRRKRRGSGAKKSVPAKGKARATAAKGRRKPRKPQPPVGVTEAPAQWEGSWEAEEGGGGGGGEGSGVRGLEGADMFWDATAGASREHSAEDDIWGDE